MKYDIIELINKGANIAYCSYEVPQVIWSKYFYEWMKRNHPEMIHEKED